MNALKKKYSGDTAAFEKKLARVMERLGVAKYQYDWNRGGCYVEMQHNGRTYRFENSVEKSRETGRNLSFVSDLFAAVVYSLEGLARAVEQDIFTLDMLLTGVPALPAAPPIEPCFSALGFTERPKTADEVKSQYRRLAKVMHPDCGGSDAAFAAMNEHYRQCLERLGASI